MEPVVDQAICLRQWDYSETSQTAVLFGRRLGIVRVLGKGTKRNDPRFSGGLEVGTLGEAVIHPKESGLSTLAGWDLMRTFRGSRATLDAHHAMMFALDVPRYLLSEGEPHVASFDGLVRALGLLGEADWRPVIARWLWDLLGDAGYRPDLGGSEHAVGFSPSLGTLVQRADGQAGVVWSLQRTTLDALVAMASGSTIGTRESERVGRLLAWYVRELAGREPPTMGPVFGRHDPKAVIR